MYTAEEKCKSKQETSYEAIKKANLYCENMTLEEIEVILNVQFKRWKREKNEKRN